MGSPWKIVFGALAGLYTMAQVIYFSTAPFRQAAVDGRRMDNRIPAPSPYQVGELFGSLMGLAIGGLLCALLLRSARVGKRGSHRPLSFAGWFGLAAALGITGFYLMVSVPIPRPGAQHPETVGTRAAGAFALATGAICFGIACSRPVVGPAVATPLPVPTKQSLESHVKVAQWLDEPAEQDVPIAPVTADPGKRLKCNLCGSLHPTEPVPLECEWCHKEWSGHEVAVEVEQVLGPPPASVYDSPVRTTPVRRGGRAGRKPEDILTPKQYLDYQHGRILAGLYVWFGLMLVPTGIWLTLSHDPNAKQQMPPLVGIIIAGAGLSGVIGGIAAFRGDRAGSRLMFVMAAIFIFGCPVGTIITILMLLGYSRHMDASDRLREAGVT
ncbi:MAG: hypothetical protein C0467_18945 [Planctomycetaceae bacterium]|nr:hypothetical protein [Planctomycetaceae bacterium]